MTVNPLMGINASDRAMTSEDKLFFISRQLDALQEEEEANALLCPYCGKMTVNGEAFCCQTMVAAVKILLDARDSVKAVLVARSVN